MDQLFRRALWVTDLHFGRSANSPQANTDSIEFLKWALDVGRTWGADLLINGGDTYDQRNGIQSLTMDYADRAIDMIADAFPRSIFLLGNHDLYHRQSRSVTPVNCVRHLSQITVVRDPLETEGCTFLPWLTSPEEVKAVRNIKSRYIFAHLETVGSLMNGGNVMPESDHAVHAEDFEGVEAVYTGHFHARSWNGRVCYTGSALAHNFGDANDDQRGLMLLEWGKDPQFVAWPDQPLFWNVKMTDLLDNPGRLLRPKMSIRVTQNLDRPLNHDESLALRTALMSDHQLRKVEFMPVQQVTQDASAGDIAVRGQSVDQIVEAALAGLEVEALDKSVLLDMYRSLELTNVR